MCGGMKVIFEKGPGWLLAAEGWEKERGHLGVGGKKVMANWPEGGMESWGTVFVGEGRKEGPAILVEKGSFSRKGRGSAKK